MTQIRTAAEAEADLRSLSQQDLWKICQESHKDFYGVRGQHMINCTVDQLVVWWLNHYQWDTVGQYWTCTETICARLAQDEWV